MAYTQTYKVEFTNEQNQEVVATIYRKDGDVVDVETYPAVAVELSDKSEGQTKYESTIICRELLLTLWTEEDDSITWETFITAEHDEWKIIIEIDSQKYFEGFITPDEGNSPFQDKPYEVTFRATNGLALLKDVDLVDINGDNFTGINSLVKYIAGALKQTGLEIPIRVYCNYFNGFMQDRSNGDHFDMFNQAYLEYRTFLENPTTFVSCYDALMIILDKFCRLEYWNGYWVIKNISELQYLPGSNYYTDYDSDGEIVIGGVDTTNHYQIGKSVDMYPINEDQQIYSRFAIKSAKTIFNYVPWPEIPKNNKFSRGTFIESGDQPDTEDMDGDGNTSEIIGTYNRYTIDDWEQGRINILDFPNPSMTPISKKFYRETIVNDYGVDIQTTVVCETDDVVTDNQFWLRSEGLPVNFGDKIKISWAKRHDNNFFDDADAAAVGNVYLVSNDNTRVVLLANTSSTGGGMQSIGTWIPGDDPPFGMAGRLILKYLDGQSTSEWNSLEVTSPQIPFNGKLYICHVCEPNVGMVGIRQYWKDFSFEYMPYVAGGFVPVKGDYWFRYQNKNFPDAAKDEVKISDSPIKMLQGALLLEDGTPTPPSWYRWPLTEARHFKQLLNITRYNHGYRRMYALDGSFNGLNSAAENDQLNKYPISFYKQYRLVDMTVQRDFVLVPPLKMDLIKGWISASLVEVKKVGDAADGTQVGFSSSFNYLFKDDNA